MSDIFGFASEPHKNGKYFVTPATQNKDGNVTCHDVSGFLAPWNMKAGGVFFKEEGGGCFCEEAMRKANMHAKNMNEGI